MVQRPKAFLVHFPERVVSKNIHLINLQPSILFLGFHVKELIMALFRLILTIFPQVGATVRRILSKSIITLVHDLWRDTSQLIPSGVSSRIFQSGCNFATCFQGKGQSNLVYTADSVSHSYCACSVSGDLYLFFSPTYMTRSRGLALYSKYLPRVATAHATLVAWFHKVFCICQMSVSPTIKSTLFTHSTYQHRSLGKALSPDVDTHLEKEKENGI